MNNVGAQYCVYEDTGNFLLESMTRVYPFMDVILVMLNYDPWFGTANIESSFETYKKIMDFPDPENKILLVSQHWKNEELQRNYGKDLLHKMGIKWCMICDDDELYNADELQNAIDYLKTTVAGVVLVHQQMYWKSKDYCIDKLSYSFPTFVLSDNKKAWFNYCRNVKVDGTWETIKPELIVNHHLSYVRTDKQMLRKVETFSHAKDFSWNDWYENVWCKWTLAMENLHVNPGDKGSISRVMEAKNSQYKLR